MAQTPGPWHHDGRRWIRNADGRGVLRVHIGANPDDVRLAAASPALLSVLQEIMDYRGGAPSALHDPYVMERAQAAMLAAEPALDAGCISAASPEVPA